MQGSERGKKVEQGVSLEAYAKALAPRLAALQAAREAVTQEQTTLSALEQRTRALEEATTLAQTVAAEVQAHAHGRIAAIVTGALEAVFDEPYTFRILFERKRGKTEARLVFERDGLQVDPLDAAGGGIIDVAAFALRVACLVLRRPPCRRLLLLDEPLRHLSAAYRPRARVMLEQLCEELGLQVVMVTHDPALRTGRIIDLSP